MEYLGYLSAIFIGLSLGLVGAGGSILTIPALVYLLNVPPVEATAYSLFIVGITSLVGGVQKFIQNDVNLRAALLFGIPSLISVFLTRLYILPSIPFIIYANEKMIFTKDHFIMFSFALLMTIASFSMIKGPRKEDVILVESQERILLIFLGGTFVGMLTGLIGIGGGFLIIPALLLLRKMPMKMAIGTSLLIIATNSFIGFAGDLTYRRMEWGMLLIFSVLAVAGILAGNKLSRGIDNVKLKKSFGWFVLAMSIYIFIRETATHIND